MRAKFLMTFLSLGTALWGAGFTIETGETVNATQVMNAAGDVGIIESGGTLNVSSGDAVTMLNTNQILSNAGIIVTSGDNNQGVNSGSGSVTITNSGTISTSGTNADAIVSGGSSCRLTNSGTISTVGTASTGMESTGSSCFLNNSGTISTLGANAFGMFATGSLCHMTNSGLISVGGGSFGMIADQEFAEVINRGTIRVTAANTQAINIGGVSSQAINYGTISTQGTQSHGIVSESNSSLMVNYGLISTADSSAIGMSSTGNSTKIINDGTISTVGATAQGIASTGSANQIVNTGLVSTTAVNAQAILSQGADVSVTNSGTILSAQSYALQFTGTNPTLTLLLGSNIQGGVITDSALNLNVEEGLNLRLTIEETNGFGRLNIPSPYVKIGNTETIAVVDRTGFTLQADVLEDLSDSLLDSIYRGKYDYLHCQELHCGAWAEAVGSFRIRRQTVYYENWEAGGLAGANWEAFCSGTLGIFGGGTYGEATVGQNTQQAQVSTALAGLSYEQMYRHLFVGFAMTTGYVGWENRRTVMYNLAPGGVQEARVDINGWMISPELTAAGWLGLSRKWSLLATATLRYAGLFLGNYDESGSSANLSINSRQVDLLKVIGELALSSGGDCWNFEPYMAVAGRFQVGGREVDGELLGQSLTFGSGSPYNLVEILYGIRGQRNVKCYTLYGNVEGLWDNDDGERVLGELGVRYLF